MKREMKIGTAVICSYDESKKKKKVVGRTKTREESGGSFYVSSLAWLVPELPKKKKKK